MSKTRVRHLALRILLAKPLSYWQLLKHIDVDIPTTQSALKELLEEGFLEYKNDVFSLAPKGKELVESLGLIPFSSLRCSSCEGKGISVSTFKHLLESFEELINGRPKAISEYDQGYVRPVDTVARVLFMYELGDIEGKRIFLLGDDDLTSLALLASGWPKEVTVLEIDERILSFIQEKADEKGWKNLNIVHYDARYPIPKELHHKYDVFLTDPVETVGGLRLFLSRCVEALKGKDGVGYFGLTHLEASRKKWRQVQKDILEMGFTITDIIRNFHTYLLEREDILNLQLRVAKEAPVEVTKPEIDFYTSNLFRIYAAEPPRPIVQGKVDWKRELYYDEEAYVTCPY